MIVRRRFPIFLTVSFLALLTFTLRTHLFANREQRAAVSISSISSALLITPASLGLKEGNETLLAAAAGYVQSIRNADDNSIDRLECSRPNAARYDHLRAPTATGPRKFFFTLILHECIEILPRLLGSVVEAIRFLGKENCLLSIVEGRSSDGTYEVLKTLQMSLSDAGIAFVLQSNDTEAKDDIRIQALADLRNLALEPLLKYNNHFPRDLTTVIFINDVAACPDDILELIFQRDIQDADMTCAMDWTHPGPDPLFYDVWIARGITGDTFFHVRDDGDWADAQELFWNDETSLSRLQQFKPFQVFACWNGMTAFTAAPILDQKIKFRVNHEGECFSGEPHLFCKDMWAQGFGKIAVVPSVNLQYTNENGRRIKHQKGYVKDVVDKQEHDTDLQITWQKDPPALVKCMPGFSMQDFKPWDEGLVRMS